jgi:hypothetical protein
MSLYDPLSKKDSSAREGRRHCFFGTDRGEIMPLSASF